MKCPFCTKPCGNSHCPYYQETNKCQLEKTIIGLEKENKRLKEHISQLLKYIESDKNRRVYDAKTIDEK